jgi:hypothetical protein
LSFHGNKKYVVRSKTGVEMHERGNVLLVPLNQSVQRGGDDQRGMQARRLATLRKPVAFRQIQEWRQYGVV